MKTYLKHLICNLCKFHVLRLQTFEVVIKYNSLKMVTKIEIHVIDFLDILKILDFVSKEFFAIFLLKNFSLLQFIIFIL
jgi:hypothetical protein